MKFMFKKFLILFVAYLLINCNKNKIIEKFENNDQKASYAIGMGLNENILHFKKNILDINDNFNKQDLITGFNFIYDNFQKKSKSEIFGIELGFQLQKFIYQNNLNNKIDKKFIIKGLLDKLDNKKTLISNQEIPLFLDNYIKPLIQKSQENNEKKNNAKRDRIAKENLNKGINFLKRNKIKSDIITTKSGLQYKIIKTGDQITKIKDNDIVKILFKGQLINGTIFESTETTNINKPIDFPVNNLIPGLKEALKLMSKGAKYKIYVPSELAYGKEGKDPIIGENEVLIFDIEILSIKSK